ncbi:MAG: FtsB family cell division protein [bacterium]
MRRRRLLAGLAALTLLLVCVHQIVGENGYLTLRQRRQEMRQLELEVRRLTEENQRFERQIQKLRSDPAAIERLAREEMKLARPGEFIFTLPAAPPPAPPPEAQAMRPPR